jgi:pantetheine-phosphate adenylyltransferase
MKRIGVFPGSFDPFTKGHVDIVQRAVPLFDEIIVAIGVNSNKKSMFSLESRIAHIEAIFETEPKVSVEAYQGLTTIFCEEKKARYLIRGIRNAIDSEYEKSIAQMNKDLTGIETVFLMTSPEYSAINSSIVREIKKNNGDISSFVTKADQLLINDK